VNGVGITKDVNYPSHDDAGKLLRMYVDSASPAYDYTFSYDGMGRFEKIFGTGQPSPFFQYQYDAASNEKQRDNLYTGVSQMYPRDELNRITRVELANDGTPFAREVYDYWPIGRLHTVTRQNNLQDQFDYFLDGELKKATYNVAATPPPTPTPPSTPTPPPGQVVTPTFNPDGAYYVSCANSYTFNVVISTTTSGAQIRYTTDGSNPNTGGMVIPNGGLAQITVGSNQTKTLKAIGFKTGMTNSNIKSADYSFERECAGPMGPAPTYPLDAAVDGLGEEPMTPETVTTVTYTLDKAGNRQSVNGQTYIPNNINQYTSAAGPVTNGNEHEISDYYGLHYTYMRDQELTRVSEPGLTYDLAYDALGRCVKRTFNDTTTTYYFYDGDKPILEYNANNALVGFNLYGKSIDEIIQRGAYGTDNQWHWYFLNQDHEGSVTYLTDSSGNVIEKYHYDVFGTPAFYNGSGVQISASAYGNRFLFTGREYAGAYVYEYRARVYHAAIGRFMSEDPKLFDAGDYNLFRYCHNDPIDFTAPMGLDITGTVTYDYDGDPHAYAVPGSGHIGHDHLANAMSQSGHLSRNVIAFKNGKPITKNGYYVSKTSWRKNGHYVNANNVRYIALGTEQQQKEGARGGTLTRAWFRLENPANGKSINIVFADSRGGNNEGVEVSRAAARAIDLRSGDQAHAVFLGNFRTGFPIDDAIQKGTKTAKEHASNLIHSKPDPQSQ
jgi:RHS repeat-associated protein